MHIKLRFPVCLKPIDENSKASRIKAVLKFSGQVFISISLTPAYNTKAENKADKNQVGPKTCSCGSNSNVFFITAKISLYLWFSPKKLPKYPVKNCGLSVIKFISIK